MASKSKPVALLEYAALRAVCGVVNAVPHPLALALARGAAVVAFSVFRFKRARTMRRISKVFPGIEPRRAAQIARESLANILQNAVDMIRASRFDRKWIERHVDNVGVYAARLKELVDEGRGVVIMVPHMGNWYMAAWAMAACGMPLSAIAARQRNPHVDAWMKRLYGSIDVVERGSARVLREVLERLANGRAFAILPDLRVPTHDVEVPFLNGTANVSHGGAAFAIAAKCPIVVAAMRRRKGRHFFDHIATLRPDPNAKDRKEEARRLTREAMSLRDKAIQKTPGQWFWFNKRWILERVHTD